jgi:hypothetical protein
MQNQPDPIGQTAAQLKAAGQSTLQVVATVAVLLYQQRQNAHNENMQRLQDQTLGAQKMYNAVKKMFGREYDKAAASFNQVYSPNFWAKTNEKEVIEKYAQASFWAQYKNEAKQAKEYIAEQAKVYFPHLTSEAKQATQTNVQTNQANPWLTQETPAQTNAASTVKAEASQAPASQASSKTSSSKDLAQWRDPGFQKALVVSGIAAGLDPQAVKAAQVGNKALNFPPGQMVAPAAAQVAPALPAAEVKVATPALTK